MLLWFCVVVAFVWTTLAMNCGRCTCNCPMTNKSLAEAWSLQAHGKGGMAHMSHLLYGEVFARFGLQASHVQCLQELACLYLRPLERHLHEILYVSSVVWRGVCKSRSCML